jgi:AcrR family transcriptional regulator
VSQINVGELAQAAGVARGTVYNNLADIDGLFSDVAAQLSAEMSERIAVGVRELKDPARRLADGIRFYARRAHEEPHWGRFICRFALNDASLQDIWTGQPTKDLLEGLDVRRFHFQREQLLSVVALLAGAVLGAIFLVLEGQKTWREAGSDAAEFFLVAIGVARGEAKSLTCHDLPDLAPGARIPSPRS